MCVCEREREREREREEREKQIERREQWTLALTDVFKGGGGVLKVSVCLELF